MRLHEIYNEAQSYYSNVYCKSDGKLWIVQDILLPDADGHTDYGDPEFSFDNGTLDMEDGLPYLTFNCRQIELSNSERGTTNTQTKDLKISDLDFSFPDTGLVNLPLNFGGITEEFNVVKYVGRNATRQWRRALRKESINARLACRDIHAMITEVTGQPSREFATGVTNNTLYRLFNPEYFSVDEALNHLSSTIGTYAISREWWIGQGKHGLVFGHGELTCGSINDRTGMFRLDNDELLFLKESLTELIGENCYEY